MNDNNIDKLFQKKLRDFEEVPDEKVWKDIEASLQQKRRKRRVVPIWWKLGGVAALLAILFTLVNPFAESDNVEKQVSDIEKISTSPNTNQTATDNTENPKTSDDVEGFVSSEQDIISKDSESVLTEDEKAVEQQNAKDSRESLISKDKSKIGVQKEKGRLAQQSTTTSKEGGKEDHAIAEGENNAIVENADNKEGTNAIVANNLDQKNEGDTKENTLKNQDSDKKNIIEPKGAEEGLAVTAEEEVKEKKSIFEEIAEMEEETLAQKEKSSTRWSVGPRVAPVYFNSFGQGSPIHSNFAANPKSGNVNLSYGLAMGYEISKKLSVRTGVHKVDYGYDTNDVLFSSSLAASNNNQFENINYTGASKNLVIQSSANGAETALDFANSAEIRAPDPSRNGRMVQQFGYLEIPVELNYALMDKRLGINLIGGMSSLFLIDNSVILESGGDATELGEANNINNTNFSTNVGIGLNYRLTPKMQLNLEPMFKYQLNTFSDSAGDFQPFSIGVYSGLSFKF